MPTGYTALISENPDITFEEFTLRCVSAMGVSIMMREEPMGKKITRESITGIRENKSYHEGELEKARKELDRIERMAPDDPDFMKEVSEEREAAIINCNEEIEKNARLRKAYESMLQKIRRWEPPTDDHKGLKKFMDDQVSESVKFDCNNDYYKKRLEDLSGPVDFAEEYEEKLSSARESVEYHSRYMEEDRGKNDNRIKWMEKLCESIGIEFE